MDLADAIAGLLTLASEVICLSHRYIIGVAEYRKEIQTLEGEIKCLIGALECVRLARKRIEGNRPYQPTY